MIKNDNGSGYLVHSTGPWKKHKYIKKEGNRYFYNYMNGTPDSRQKRAASPDSDPETNYTKRANYMLRNSLKKSKTDTAKNPIPDNDKNSYLENLEMINKISPDKSSIMFSKLKDVFSDKKYQKAIGKGMEYFKSLINNVNEREKEKAKPYDLILSPYESDVELLRTMGPKERSKLESANEEYHKDEKNDNKYLMPYGEHGEREYPKGMSYSNRFVNASRKAPKEMRKNYRKAHYIKLN